MKHGKIEQIGSHRKQCRGMYDLLQEYVRAGIRLCLDGKEAEPGQVAATCLREGVSYMMDFIPDSSSSQKITEIDFNRIEGPGVSPPAVCAGSEPVTTREPARGSAPRSGMVRIRKQPGYPPIRPHQAALPCSVILQEYSGFLKIFCIELHSMYCYTYG